MPYFRAVLFDMDGVITHTMPYHYRAWNKVFHEQGLSVPRFEVYKREGQKGIESVREIFAAHGKPFTLKQGNDILRRKEELFKEIARTRFVPGARAFIHSLSKYHVPMALVTGTDRHEVEKILPKNIYSAFEAIVSGSDVKNGKPHPEPYLRALKRLKTRKKDAVVIENAPLGILSAKKAGLTCFALETSLPKKYLSGADHVFPGFKELSFYLQKNYGL